MQNTQSRVNGYDTMPHMFLSVFGGLFFFQVILHIYGEPSHDRGLVCLIVGFSD